MSTSRTLSLRLILGTKHVYVTQTCSSPSFQKKKTMQEEFNDRAFPIERYCNVDNACDVRETIRDNVQEGSEAWDRLRRRVVNQVAEDNLDAPTWSLQFFQLRTLDQMGLTTEEESKLANQSNEALNLVLDGKCTIC